jgi:predicted metal-dependent hydrolase
MAPRIAPLAADLPLADRTVPLAVRRSRRARRMHLRVDPGEALVELVLPHGVGLAEGLRFARDRRDWIAERLDAIPVRIAFEPESVLPVFGADVVIRHRPELRGAVRRVGNELIVAGRPEHVGRRVRDWMREHARAELTRRARLTARRLGRDLGSVRMGDPKTRWGSCSAAGSITLSWRLALAPEHVVDYVVAHEVAHLAELNHGPRFWRLLDILVPGNEPARVWLRHNGARLHRYG